MKHIDFMENADNVYSTKNYIVAQKLKTTTLPDGKKATFGVDVYYKRNPERDTVYAKLFTKNNVVSGGRIYCRAFARIYKD